MEKCCSDKRKKVVFCYYVFTGNNTRICFSVFVLCRSVLAASSVFDMAIIVIDSSKGIQQQTAEHLLLASLLCPDHIILILNKVGH